MSPSIAEEREHRFVLWRELASRGGPRGVRPALVKQLGLHRGQQGIFRDIARTEALGYSSGVAVGLLHTGRVYSDDVTDEGLIYHYPATVRGGRDENEVRSIKLCRELHLPLFVIVKPHPSATTRDVRLGWVQNWNDRDSSILIQFSESEAEPNYVDTSVLDESDFQLKQKRRTRRALAKVRPNQVQFRFEVFKRYGTGCAVCEIKHPDLLQAAHLCPFQYGGSDDARNGLVFCLNHHRAFDKQLFRIDPYDLSIVVAGGVAQAELGIHRRSIRHLPRLPHPEALAWAFGEPLPEDDTAVNGSVAFSEDSATPQSVAA